MSRGSVSGSPARQLVQLVWDNTSRDSWLRLNEVMRDAVGLAISAGLRFAKDDIGHFSKTMRMHYWASAEGLYSAAVPRGNISACQAIEAFKGRTPFMFEDERIYVGREFVWQGDAVTCTSIDKDSLIACSYRNGRDGKIKRRYTVTLEEVQAIGKASRAEKKAAKEAKEKAEREAEEQRRAEEEERRRRWEEQRQKDNQERLARLAGLSPDLLARAVTVEDGVAAGLCRDGIIDFCKRYAGGRQAGTMQEVIELASKVEEGHYLDSIELLARHLAGPLP